MQFPRFALGVCCGAVLIGLVGREEAAAAPEFGPVRLTLCGEPAPPASSTHCGFSLVARSEGPQVALMSPLRRLVVSARENEQVEVAIEIRGLAGQFTLRAKATVVGGDRAEVGLSAGQPATVREVAPGETVQLDASGHAATQPVTICLRTAAQGHEAAVRWEEVYLVAGGVSSEVPLRPTGGEDTLLPPPVLPELRPAIEEALVEWDWRMQDGIGAQRAPSTYAEAIRLTLDRGDLLIRDLQAGGTPLGDKPAQCKELRRRWETLSRESGSDFGERVVGERVAGVERSEPPDRRIAGGSLTLDPGHPNLEAQWEDLWHRVHTLRRRIALDNPLAQAGPLALVKQVPGAFSHQLTQYYGRYARPGGGVFVLDEPGRSMRCRRLAEAVLPQGSYQHLDVSYDGRRVLFSFCEAATVPDSGIEGQRGRYYHLYEVATDGSDLRQLTDGPFDDFAPRHLPDGRIVFVSTRRLGWHRCGYPGCENYTLALAEADGSHPRTISRHETNEWDPAVLADGRIVYTRWDYVDRHAVYYEQLWTARPDGTAAAAFYGNNTFNPVGVWEARQVPGSSRIMATAAAHHAMTAGSIVLLDVTRGIDGPDPITRLTPEVPFPESEAVLLPQWSATAGIVSPPPVPIEAVRWPGHCYRSPYPLSENYFLAAYSFDPLIGEPQANRPNMFGIYLVDRFGNKELLYRDLNIASLWPMPLRARPRPPVVPPAPSDPDVQEGTVFLENVYAADPPLPEGSIKRLRIVQVLPKSTPGINRPPVGIPNASPGKQVLGTVPVEPDGSALFRVPAGTPLSFQALDAHGQAVQIMRSITYLRPGERASCVGCHEPRSTAPPGRRTAQALCRGPSTIEPCPEGSKPLSYPILVQPVLERKCVSCHSPQKPEGGVVLTGQPQGHYTVSYNALAPRVSYSAWGGKPGDFRQVNSEPLSKPEFFGARGSPLMKMLLEGHEEVRLTPEEMERLVTWMDANALFYGTFDPADQARQQAGQRIAGPKLQ